MVEYKLGEWNLSEITKNPKSPEFQKKIKEVQVMSNKFEKIKSKLDPKMSSKNFMKILHDLEDISEKMSLIGGYASLSYSANTQSDEATSLMTRISKLGSDISNKILFFAP
jgi:oligoendopeptidase F